MDELSEHYGSGYEAERLRSGSSRIEFERTKELLERFLPPAPASVLDVGGGPGVYAAWLSDRGYRVHLVDASPKHVELATSRSRDHPFSATLGDARSLDVADLSVDAVLFFGPLYHLIEREDRVRALHEARRVVRPGGSIIVAAISRFASLLDGLVNGWLGDPEFDTIVSRDLADGQHRNPTNRADWFTTAFFHLPGELRSECEDAGLQVDGSSASRVPAGSCGRSSGMTPQGARTSCEWRAPSSKSQPPSARARTCSR